MFTIDVTIGGVFDYVGLKDFKICHLLSLTMIRGLKGEVVCGKEEIVTRSCCKRSRCGTTFQCTNGEMENGFY